MDEGVIQPSGPRSYSFSETKGGSLNFCVGYQLAKGTRVEYDDKSRYVHLLGDFLNKLGRAKCFRYIHHQS